MLCDPAIDEAWWSLGIPTEWFCVPMNDISCVCVFWIATNFPIATTSSRRFKYSSISRRSVEMPLPVLGVNGSGTTDGSCWCCDAIVRPLGSDVILLPMSRLLHKSGSVVLRSRAIFSHLPTAAMTRDLTPGSYKGIHNQRLLDLVQISHIEAHCKLVGAAEAIGCCRPLASIRCKISRRASQKQFPCSSNTPDTLAWHETQPDPLITEGPAMILASLSRCQFLPNGVTVASKK